MSPFSEKCNQADADLLHSYAKCPKLEEFWAALGYTGGIRNLYRVHSATLCPVASTVEKEGDGNI